MSDGRTFELDAEKGTFEQILEDGKRVPVERLPQVGFD